MSIWEEKKLNIELNLLYKHRVFYSGVAVFFVCVCVVIQFNILYELFCVINDVVCIKLFFSTIWIHRETQGNNVNDALSRNLYVQVRK